MDIVYSDWKEVEGDLEGILSGATRLAIQRYRGIPDFGGYNFHEETVFAPVLTETGELIDDGEGNIYGDLITIVSLVTGGIVTHVAQRLPPGTLTAKLKLHLSGSVLSRLCWLVHERLKMIELYDDQGTRYEASNEPGFPLHPELTVESGWQNNSRVEFGASPNFGRDIKVKILNEGDKKDIIMVRELQEMQDRRDQAFRDFFEETLECVDNSLSSLHGIEQLLEEIETKRQQIIEFCYNQNIDFPPDADWIVRTGDGNYIDSYNNELRSDEEIELTHHVPQEFLTSESSLWEDEPDDAGGDELSDTISSLEESLTRNEKDLERMLAVYYFAYKKYLLADLGGITNSLRIFQTEIQELMEICFELEQEVEALRQAESDDDSYN